MCRLLLTCRLPSAASGTARGGIHQAVISGDSGIRSCSLERYSMCVCVCVQGYFLREHAPLTPCINAPLTPCSNAP
jgi:hypothetical protein